MGKGIDDYHLDGNLVGGITKKEDAERLANWMHSQQPVYTFVHLYSDKEEIYHFIDAGTKISANVILDAPWDKANRIRAGGALDSETSNERTARELWAVLQILGVVKDVG